MMRQYKMAIRLSGQRHREGHTPKADENNGAAPTGSLSLEEGLIVPRSISLIRIIANEMYRRRR